MANTAFRGEILLTATELESFKERMNQLWASAADEGATVDVPWKLTPLDAAVARAHSLLQSELSDLNATLSPKRERSSSTLAKRNAIRRTLSADVAGRANIDEDIDSIFKEIMDEELDEIDNTITPHQAQFQHLDEPVEYDDTSSVYPVLHPDNAVLANMPPWVEKFHDVISSLCRTKSGSVFVKPLEIDLSNLSNTTEEQEPLPQLPNVTLQIVLEKLLSNNYTSATEAFAEVYSLLLTMFKFQDPGTMPWMSTHDACCKLEKLRRDSGLVDSETANVSFGGKHPPAPLPNAFSKRPQVTLGIVAETRPISADEKVQFQDVLAALSPENHVELYIAFEYLAVWRNVGNGEIELDDDATNPNVFRDMLRWARQVTGDAGRELYTKQM
ncbi:uncharacterized protein BXIN_1033 [Babesia sp. Xinjiang]|uniref:uncharacterized protein n=1 Tax=Babesia sp. Xinjiang TaxID=462227 RepID=UPI000A22095A|nr:uncharacterized protein BXIN_1033 [Babesia sp. Xinjiang]ORM42013.1 hypothetical protein BXIN_1033 [Babesia sp. Xinjiang]